MPADTAEHKRLDAEAAHGAAWKHWGPYLAERQWGTVREDYSEHGTAWDYFPHDHARSRAYRWGEDGIGGLSDAHQRLCISLALWNTRDPILKERLFGLTNSEGNHGEDVKELYYYLDAAPSHAYLKMLYKYPQREFPYAQLVEENRRRGISQPELELIDTEAFADDRYFDVVIEYAQAGPEDILMRVTAHNRGPESAPLHLLPQLWFRNTWSWDANCPRPCLLQADDCEIELSHPELGERYLYADRSPRAILFCDNDSNAARLWGEPAREGYWKDGIHERVVNGRESAVNPAHAGTKAAVWHELDIPAHGSRTVQLRLAPREISQPFADFKRVFAARIRETDEYYAHLQAGIDSVDARRVQRQAFAGLIWRKQYFHYDLPRRIKGDPPQPPPPAHPRPRPPHQWVHPNNTRHIP